MSQPRTALTTRRRAGFHLGVRRSWPPTAAAAFCCLGSGHKQVNLNTLDYIYPLRDRLLSRVALDGETNFTKTGLRDGEACKGADGRRERRRLPSDGPSLPFHTSYVGILPFKESRNVNCSKYWCLSRSAGGYVCHTSFRINKNVAEIILQVQQNLDVKDL